jgi:hypothetical protein
VLKNGKANLQKKMHQICKRILKLIYGNGEGENCFNFFSHSQLLKSTEDQFYSQKEKKKC